jgi:hypothetical protein
MKTIKSIFFATTGILAALILAPFLAFFGLIMLGLTFGLSLLAVGTVAVVARQATMPENTADQDATPVDGDLAPR